MEKANENAICELPDEIRLQMAALDYSNFKSRRTNPDGGFDRAGRWYPSESERSCCCNEIRSPSRSHQYSLLTHCRSALHLSEKYKVDRIELIRLAKTFSK